MPEAMPDHSGRPPRGSRLAFLWRPHPSIQSESHRRRARIAMVLLLAIVALGALDLAASLAGAYGNDPTGSAIEAVSVVLLGVAYFLARTRHVVVAVCLAVAVIDLTILHFRSEAAPGSGDVLTLYFLAVPILVAGLLLPLRWALLAAVGTIGVALAVEARLDTQTGVGWDVEDFGLLLMLVSVSVLSVAAATLTDRDARLLSETAQTLRQLSENIPEVFFVVAADANRAYYASPAYETMWGRPVSGFLADPLDWLKGLHPDDLERVKANLMAPPAEGLEFRVVHPSGTVRHVRSRTFPVLDASGKAVRLVGLAEDVTQARRAQEQLREAQRQRIHLLQELAHDLASPLSPVKIQLRLLKDRLDGQGQRSLEIVRRNVDHLEKLVSDVRDVARLEGTGLKLERQEADLAALARETVETLGPLANERQVHVQVEAPAAIPVHADARRMTQVLYNLVGNAVKFTPPGGHVTLKLAREPGKARVDVADSGQGMRPDQVGGLFRPFSQVHEPGAVKRPEDKGTGLGLYISKGIVEAHGGHIEAASLGPGLGSTFTFFLPLPAQNIP